MFSWANYEMVAEPQSDFARIFGAKPTYKYVRKATYRGGSGRRFHHVENLTREEALHWLAHDPHGRSFARERGEPTSDLADLLVEASLRPTEKRKDTNMQNMDKTLREVGEHGFTKMVEKYAKTVHPTLTREQAFTKVFTEDNDEGRAIRRAWQISKGQGIAAGALDEPSQDDDEEGDALDDLNALAAEERRRNPKLTKAQAFTKAYTDPANAQLAQRERRANRPR
jgi:hypothetical protein